MIAPERSSPGELGNPSGSPPEQPAPQFVVADRLAVAARLPTPHVHPRQHSTIGQASGSFGSHRCIVAARWDRARRLVAVAENVWGEMSDNCPTDRFRKDARTVAGGGPEFQMAANLDHGVRSATVRVRWKADEGT